jgi:hypothetical protein
MTINHRISAAAAANDDDNDDDDDDDENDGVRPIRPCPIRPLTYPI